MQFEMSFPLQIIRGKMGFIRGFQNLEKIEKYRILPVQT